MLLKGMTNSVYRSLGFIQYLLSEVILSKE